MEGEKKALIGFIIILLLILSLLAILIIREENTRPDVNEFCVRNGYVGAWMNDINSGVCLKPNQYGFRYPPEQYFGWDGSNWRFVE